MLFMSVFTYEPEKKDAVINRRLEQGPLVQEGTKIIWETIQTAEDLSASWRGEIEGNAMQGILSLRLGEETQDFSFISRGYRRRK